MYSTDVKAETASTTPIASSSPTTLTIFWLEVLELAHANDDAAIAQKLATLQLRKEDLDELFGAGSGSKLWTDYTRAFTSFAGEGAAEIAKKIRERRYDDVEVLPLNGSRRHSGQPAPGSRMPSTSRRTS